MTNSPKRLLLITGELSGDAHASTLAQEIKTLSPQTTLFGIGGDKLAKSVDHFIEHVTLLSATGFLESFYKQRKINAFLKRLNTFLEQEKIDKVIIIDFQHQNEKIAAVIKAFSIPIITYITPNFWIWNDIKKAKQVIRYSDDIICIFEKEYNLYNSLSQNVHYFGHPLNHIKPLQKKAAASALTIGLYPGSREHEIKDHLPVMLESAYLLNKDTDKKTLFNLIVSHDHFRNQIESLLEKYKCKGFIKLIDANQKNSLEDIDLAITIPGTHTLETCLYGVPQIMIGKISWITYFIIQYVLRLNIPFLSLPNIITSKMMIPELIQGNATAKNLTTQIHSLINNFKNKNNIPQTLSLDALAFDPNVTQPQKVATFITK